MSEAAPATRSGFVAVGGRPNVGKSTLVNAIVGGKVAIVSDKPQTTRRAIRGVATSAARQLVLVDLPGVQRPRDALTSRMQKRVEQELSDCDAALLLLNAVQGVGPGDRFLAGLLAGASTPVVIGVNKEDACSRPQMVKTLSEAGELANGGEVFPLSARTGRGVGELVDHLASLLPEGPFMFPVRTRTDQSESVLLAELIREQVLRRTRQEVPHSVEVQVDEVEERDGVIVVRAHVWVETESQKGIVIGSGGRMVKAIGTGARRSLEAELGGQVHLELSVRVRRHWRADENLLNRLGIE